MCVCVCLCAVWWWWWLVGGLAVVATAQLYDAHCEILEQKKNKTFELLKHGNMARMLYYLIRTICYLKAVMIYS